ncbi:hypothetical protein [Streptomyces sp. CBMA156]|uniref:hypothetical protein n=1 Tax=Streptomyces sp. CBMA156 TaxID=1930280 RepID=UPI001661DDB8|nr:hypothetical protein [Streptomyces sp. CBMA156]
MSFNPATMNNNGLFPTYDFRTADLYWHFLNVYGITAENFREKFPPWAFSMQGSRPASGEDVYEPPSGWNAYGANDWWLHVQPRHTPDGKGAVTTVTGGQTEYGALPPATKDPLVGALVNLAGDSFPIADLTAQEQFGDGHFPRAAHHSAATMADNNPDSIWSTAFFVNRIQIGDKTDSEKYFYGDIEDDVHSSARWNNFSRNLNLKDDVFRDGTGATVIQACVRRENLQFASDESPLMNAVKQEMENQKALGVMVRFSVYLTHYFTAPEFATCTTQKERFIRLLDLWKQDLDAGNPPRRNPCVSRVVGTIGLWHDREFATVPGGRFLAPENSMPLVDAKGHPVNGPDGKQRQAWFGPAVAEVHKSSGGTRFVSLDLEATVPEVDAAGEKETAFGTLELFVQVPGSGAGTTKTVAEIKPEAYDRQAYEATSGIIDVPVDGKVTDADLATGTLGVRCKPNSQQITMLTEKVLTAQTDSRSNYIDQGGTGTVVIEVRDRGVIPTGAVKLLLQQYVPDPLPPARNADSWVKPAPDVLTITPGTVVDVVDGRAEIAFKAAATVGKDPQLPVIAFFPYEAGSPQPAVPDKVTWVGPGWSFASAFYCCVRMLPFDNGLPAEFAKDCEAHGNNQKAAWDFVYRKIFYLYDMIFPVMKHYAALDLGDKTAVDRNIDQILELCATDMANSSLYMPVTRDLSSGKRQVLEMYRNLLRTGKPQEVAK